MDPSQEQQLHASSPSRPLIGALLVHGLNGNKSDMAEMEEMLPACGIVVMPGHGSHVRDMLSLGWTEWSAAVSSELSTLKRRCEHALAFVQRYTICTTLY